MGSCVDKALHNTLNIFLYCPQTHNYVILGTQWHTRPVVDVIKLLLWKKYWFHQGAGCGTVDRARVRIQSSATFIEHIYWEKTKKKKSLVWCLNLQKMWKQATLFLSNIILQNSFRLGGNQDFLDFLQKKFYNINYYYCSLSHDVITHTRSLSLTQGLSLSHSHYGHSFTNSFIYLRHQHSLKGKGMDTLSTKQFRRANWMFRSLSAAGEAAILEFLVPWEEKLVKLHSTLIGTILIELYLSFQNFKFDQIFQTSWFC